MKRSVVAGLLTAMMVSGSVCGQTEPHAAPPRVGSINYVEGQALLNNEALSPSSAGSVALEGGQLLTTHTGKAEVLLTPGIFLRVADNSSVKMISPDLANTSIQLLQGRAMVEVLDIHKENNIRVNLDDVSAQLVNKGLYDFDADHHEVRVFKGTARLYAGTQNIKLTGNHELTLNTGKLTPHAVDSRPYEDDFFRWNALRSGYLSEAGVDAARTYIGVGPGWYGPHWYGPGWYWDPWFGAWTFVPANGIFYSPFGWGFYSPIVVYRSPFFYNGYWGHGPHRFEDFHAPYGHGFEPSGGFHGGGFHGGSPSDGVRR